MRSGGVGFTHSSLMAAPGTFPPCHSWPALSSSENASGRAAQKATVQGSSGQVTACADIGAGYWQPLLQDWLCPEDMGVLLQHIQKCISETLAWPGEQDIFEMG